MSAVVLAVCAVGHVGCCVGGGTLCGGKHMIIIEKEREIYMQAGGH